MTDFLSQITSNHARRGQKSVFSGSEGVGKTSTSSHLSDPVFIVTPGEQSLGTLLNAGEIPAVPSFPIMETWPDMLEALKQLRDSEKVPGTLVVDAMDGVEQICVDYIIKSKFGGSREGFLSYGQGWSHTADAWREFLALLDQIADQGTHVVLLAHLEVKRFIAPESVDYDRWQPAANKSIWALTSRWADNIFQFSYFQHVVDGERGTRPKARGTSERVLYCTPAPSRVCKNRSGLNESYSLGQSPASAAKVLKQILNLEPNEGAAS
jgi:hypothetical protein